MRLFDIAAILIGLTAVFGFINYRLLRLPHTIGIVLIAMVASLAVIGLDLVLPHLRLAHMPRRPSNRSISSARRWKEC